MNLVTFLLILTILGIIIGVLNKGARGIAFFVALMAIVLLINTPGNNASNLFTNFFGGSQTAQNQTTQAPASTQPYYNPNASGTATSNPNTTYNGNTGSTAQGSSGDLPSQPAQTTQTAPYQAPAQAQQPAVSQPQVLPGNNSTITNNTGSGTYPSNYPYPPRRALW